MIGIEYPPNFPLDDDEVVFDGDIFLYYSGTLLIPMWTVVPLGTESGTVNNTKSFSQLELYTFFTASSIKAFPCI